MSNEDLEFAKRTVKYLRTNGLRPPEIVTALEEELDCPPDLAARLASAA